MDESLAEHVRRLYASSPDGFVAARNDLVKQLKRDDDRDAATAVARLRRPSWIDGALNRVARDEPEIVAEFTDAARTAHRIQQADAEGKRTASLPDALRSVRTAQGRLAKVGSTALVDLGRKADLAGVAARLGQIGGEPSALDLLTAGVLGLDDDELAEPFLGDAAPGSLELSADADADADANGSGEDRIPDPQAQIDAASRAAKVADKEARVAATAARRASERRDRAIAAVEAAEAAVRDAEAALERSRTELAEHEERAANAERAADEAARVAADAATHLDELAG